MTLLQSELQDKPLFDGFMAPPPLHVPEADNDGACRAILTQSDVAGLDQSRCCLAILKWARSIR